jgi:hypothetical protein
VQKFHLVSETVTKNVRTNGDAGSRFDGRNNTESTVALLHHPRFLFHVRKDDREIIVVIRIMVAAGPIKGSAATSAIESAWMCASRLTPLQSTVL